MHLRNFFLIFSLLSSPLLSFSLEEELIELRKESLSGDLIHSLARARDLSERFPRSALVLSEIAEIYSLMGKQRESSEISLKILLLKDLSQEVYDESLSRVLEFYPSRQSSFISSVERKMQEDTGKEDFRFFIDRKQEGAPLLLRFFLFKKEFFLSNFFEVITQKVPLEIPWKKEGQEIYKISIPKQSSNQFEWIVEVYEGKFLVDLEVSSFDALRFLSSLPLLK